MNWECPHCKKHDLLICPSSPDLDNPNRAYFTNEPQEPEYICVACVRTIKHSELAIATLSPNILEMSFEHSSVIFILDEW